MYNTTAPDFDAVCLGSAQATVREIARAVSSHTILDMVGRESDTIREALTSALERYGVRVTKVLVVRVDPPADFLATREARRLAVMRASQQEEEAGLDRRVQSDRDALARQEAQARFERAKEQAELEAAIRRREIELDADIEALRLEKLQERLARFPEAARWDWAGERLKVARELAGNSRAMLNIGGTGDVAEAWPPARSSSRTRPAPQTPRRGSPRRPNDASRRAAGARCGRADPEALDRHRESEDDEDGRGNHLHHPDVDGAERSCRPGSPALGEREGDRAAGEAGEVERVGRRQEDDRERDAGRVEPGREGGEAPVATLPDHRPDHQDGADEIGGRHQGRCDDRTRLPGTGHVGRGRDENERDRRLGQAVREVARRSRSGAADDQRAGGHDHDRRDEQSREGEDEGRARHREDRPVARGTGRRRVGALVRSHACAVVAAR